MNDIKKLKELAQNFRVLYVEDEEYLRYSVVIYLKKFFQEVVSAKDGLEALELYRHGDFDIVITDIGLPYLNGLNMAKKIKELNHKQEILIVSAYKNLEYFNESIQIGISGYIIKPIDYIQMNKELYKIVDKLKRFRENQRYHYHLEKLIEETKKEKEKLQAQKIENYQQTLLALVDMIEKRDSYTGGHSHRVAKYSVMIAKELGCREEECNKLYQAGILHDIGKISTPDSILLRPSKLNKIEYKLIKEHVTVGFNMLNKISMYKELADIIHYHHEKYDGNGYPEGLSGEDIPFLARIMMVADAFDAMTTNRIYKKSKTIKEALKEIKDLSGIQFHPEVANASIKALDKISVAQSISQLPKNELEQERFSYFYKDQIVDAYKNYLDLLLSKNHYEKEYKCINIFFIRNFTKYNQKYGWNEGDKLLSKFAIYLKKSFPSSLIFRIYGDDFLILDKEHIEISDDFTQNIDFIKDTCLHIYKKHINIYDENITSVKNLEKCIFAY